MAIPGFPEDPLSFMEDPLGSLGYTPRKRPKEVGIGPGQVAPLTAAPPLEGEEEEGFWSTIGGGLLHGLGYAGELLDKLGGRAIRGGVLGGKPRELLSIIPLSDTLEITDPRDKVSGAELLDVDPSTTSGFLSGLALEIATDPASLVLPPLGSMGKFGKAAAKIGALTKEISPATKVAPAVTRPMSLAEMMRGFQTAEEAAPVAAKLGLQAEEVVGKPLAGMVKLPFLEPIGTGPISQGIARGGRWLKEGFKGLPGIKHLGSLFGGKYGGAIERPAQEASEHLYDIAQPKLTQEARKAFGEAAESATETGIRNTELEELIPLGVEKKGLTQETYETLPPAIREWVDEIVDQEARRAGAIPEGVVPSDMLIRQTRERVFKDAGDIAAKVGEHMDVAVKQKLAEMGDDLGDVGLGYFPRSRAGGVGQATKHREKIFTGRGFKGEEDELLEVAIGAGEALPRSTISRMAADPKIRELAEAATRQAEGLAEPAAAQALREPTEAELLERVLGQPVTPLPEELAGRASTKPQDISEAASYIKDRYGIKNNDQANRLADYFGSQPATSRYYNRPLQDLQSYQENMAKYIGTRQLQHDVAARTAVRIAKGEAVPEGFVPVGKYYKDLGLDLRGTGAKGEIANPKAMDYLRQMRSEFDPKQAGEWHIPGQIIRDVKHHNELWRAPAGLRPFTTAWSKIQNFFKSWLYLPFPGSHVRNYAGAFWDNVATGAGWKPGFWDDSKKIADVVTQKGLAKKYESVLGPGLTDDQAAKKLAQWGWEDNVHPVTGTRLTGELGTDFDAPLLGALPGEKGFIPKATLADLKGTAKEYLQVHKTRGVSGEETLHPLLRAGEKAEIRGNYMGRFAHYLDRLLQGYDRPVAAALSQIAHRDYACVDEKTEILTARGWLNLDQVRVGDLALTIDPESRAIRWSEIDAVNVYPSPGKLVHWRTSRLDALTTSNHRWLAAGVGRRGGHWTTREGPWQATHFATTDECRDGRKKMLLLAGGQPDFAIERPQYSDEFVELVGWYITEGWFDKNDRHGVYVSQSGRHNPGYVSRIRGLCEHYASSGVTAKERKPRDHGWGPIHTFRFGLGIGGDVKRAAPDKQLSPEFLCSLTTHQLNLLYQTLVAGDGHVCPKGRISWSQKCQQRVDAFQMLCAMLGKRTRSRRNPVGQSDVVVYRSKFAHSKAISKREVIHEGRVWCPTTAAGTWMARRNGTTYWTGNSLSPFEKSVARNTALFYTYARKNLPEQVRRLLTRPAPTAAGIRAATAGQEEGFVPEYLQSGLAIPLGESETGEKRFLAGLGLPFEEAFGRLHTKPSGALAGERTADELISMLSPPLKAPIEKFVTGRQAFSGRDLEDLYSPTGYRDLDWALSNLPSSRLYGVGQQLRQVFTGRKDPLTAGINVFTGARITDVDMDKYRRIEGRQRIEQMMKDDEDFKSFVKVYVPKEKQGELTSEQVDMYRAWKTLDRETQIEGLRRKAERGDPEALKKLNRLEQAEKARKR